MHFSERVNFSELNAEESDFHLLRELAKGNNPNVHQTDPKEALSAAYELVGDLLNKNKPEHVQEVYEMVISNLTERQVFEGVTVSVPIRTRLSNIDLPNDHPKLSSNPLANIYTFELTKALQQEAQKRGDKITFSSTQRKRILKIDASAPLKRRTACTITRFGMQPSFDLRQFNKGDVVLVTDDCIQAGASTINVVSELVRKGCQIAGISAFSGIPEMVVIRPMIDPEVTINQILKINKEITGTPESICKLREKLDSALEFIGMCTQSLTSREILMLAAILTDDSSDKSLDFLNYLKNSLGYSENVIEWKQDSIADLVSASAVSPEDFHRKLLSNTMVQFVLSQQSHVLNRDQGCEDKFEKELFLHLSASVSAAGRSAMTRNFEREGYFPANTLFIRNDYIQSCFDKNDFRQHDHPELMPGYRSVYKDAILQLVKYAVDNSYCIVFEDHLQDLQLIENILLMIRKGGYSFYSTGLVLSPETLHNHMIKEGADCYQMALNAAMTQIFAVNWEIISSKLDFGVSFTRLGTGEVNAGRDQERFSSASLYKFGETLEGSWEHERQLNRWREAEINPEGESWAEIFKEETDRIHQQVPSVRERMARSTGLREREKRGSPQEEILIHLSINS